MPRHLVIWLTCLAGIGWHRGACGDEAPPPNEWITITSDASSPHLPAAEPTGDSAADVRSRRHWTELLKDHQPGGWSLDVGGSLRHRFEHQNQFNYPFHAYGVYAMLKPLPCTVDLFYIRKESYGDPTDRPFGIDVNVNINTFGFYVDGTWEERWDYGGTFAHSFGKHDLATVEAYGANARLGYTFDVPWQVRLGVQYSYGSEDPEPGRGRYRTFDGLFGAIDSMYGWMNIFAWQNLRDYQATFSMKPTPKTEFILDWHYFQLDAAQDAWYYSNGRRERQDPTGASGRELGHEIDFIAHYRWSDHLRLRTGYSHFFPGSFIRRTGPSPQADWVYFQVTYEF